MNTNIFMRCLKGAGLALLLGQSALAAAPAGPAAPEFELNGSDGKISLASFKNKVVYLDFWASWCAPCRKSFPWMNEMERRYHQRGLVVLAINLDKEKELAEKFLHDIPAQFTVAYDPDGKVAEMYGVQGMPSSYIIDKDGRIVQTHLGFRQEDAAELEKQLKFAIGPGR